MLPQVALAQIPVASELQPGYQNTSFMISARVYLEGSSTQIFFLTYFQSFDRYASNGPAEIIEPTILEDFLFIFFPFFTSYYQLSPSNTNVILQSQQIPGPNRSSLTALH